MFDVISQFNHIILLEIKSSFYGRIIFEDLCVENGWLREIFRGGGIGEVESYIFSMMFYYFEACL